MKRVIRRVGRGVATRVFRRARRRRRGPVVFTHVPKAAGMALVQAIESALASQRSLVGFDDSLFGAFQAFSAFAPEERARVFLDDRDYPKDADFIGGHFSYQTTRRIYPDADHVIVIREPVSRLMSHWIYWRAQDDAKLHGLGAWGDIVRLSRGTLEDFLAQRAVACQTDNACLRALLHGHPQVPADDFIDPRADATLLRAARKVLRAYAFADILEDDAMLGRLAVFLRAPFALMSLNETPPVPSELRTGLAGAFTPNATAALVRSSRLDMQLWADLARRRMTHAQVSLLRARIRMQTTARHAALMMPTA